MQKEFFTVEQEGKSDTQGGGHGRINKCCVIIPCISKPLDHREGNAYQVLQNTPLISIIPKFYGIHDGSIVISDMTAGWESPCLADLKIGTRHWDLSAPQAKIDGLVEKQKGTTTNSHGIRLIDAKIRKSGKVTNHWDKVQGLKYSHDELKNVVNEFVPSELKNQCKEQMQVILDKLSETRQKYPGFRMYASSVLIGYDGDHPENGMRSCIIDFAHTYLNVEDDGGKADDPELEDNIQLGMKTLISML